MLGKSRSASASADAWVSSPRFPPASGSQRSCRTLAGSVMRSPGALERQARPTCRDSPGPRREPLRPRELRRVGERQQHEHLQGDRVIAVQVGDDEVVEEVDAQRLEVGAAELQRRAQRVGERVDSLRGVTDVAEQASDRVEVLRAAGRERREILEDVDDIGYRIAERVDVEPGDHVEVPAGVCEDSAQIGGPLGRLERGLGEAQRLVEDRVQEVALAHGATPVTGPKSAGVNVIGCGAA